MEERKMEIRRMVESIMKEGRMVERKTEERRMIRFN